MMKFKNKGNEREVINSAQSVSAATISTQSLRYLKQNAPGQIYRRSQPWLEAALQCPRDLVRQHLTTLCHLTKIHKRKQAPFRRTKQHS